ncbi:hypothetical protein AWP83_23575 [Escherichia coli]|nr:hypothetical protein AWP83_23575 [Escherichia coli]OKW95003.1 hypothetical protein AWP87_20950 [Escherichia coli]
MRSGFCGSDKAFTPHPTFEHQCLMRLLSGRPNALDMRFTLYRPSGLAQIINNKLCFLISPGKVAYLFSNKT